MGGLSRCSTVVVGCAAGLLLGAGIASAETGPEPGVGYDVSYPQCTDLLPADADFAVVGVNGGRATSVNPCLAEQLTWAAGSTGALPGLPALQVYVNTANPGQVRQWVTTWPSSGESPYGGCDGGPGPACSWVYGQTRAAVDIHAFLLPAARVAGVDVVPAELVWWLDVESVNTWQTGSAGAQANNRATLEGMVDYLAATGAPVGLYSTGPQWREIVGWVPPGSALYELDSWLAGADSRVEAADHCTHPSLTGGGEVVLAQYVILTDGRLLDHDLPCPR